MNRIRILIALIVPTLIPQNGWAHGKPEPSLRGVKIPVTPGLVGGKNPIIVSQKTARILGKALFWDMNVGSARVACATCHYHAGADERSVNQMNTGELHKVDTGLSFQPSYSQMLTGSMESGLNNTNYQLKKDDFPFWRFKDPSDKKSLIFSTDDVVGSSGTFQATFASVVQNPYIHDDCSPVDVTQSPYHAEQSNLGTRQTTARNAPTVINAALNFSNFWDGRANNIFNGSSPWGVRDPDAGVWVAGQAGLYKQSLKLINASLASQAVGPPTNDVEMSCRNRLFPDIGRKLLDRRPLDQQEVAIDDSVLRGERDPTGKGLSRTYRSLIRKAFNRRYWSGSGRINIGGQSYEQMEANFPLFFGLALKLYQDTLISDRSPYDTPLVPWSGKPITGGKVPLGLNEQQRRGLFVFLSAHCQNCHGGPTFSAAANPMILRNKNPDGPILVDRLSFIDSAGAEGYALRDTGFANTGVVPTAYDPGQNTSDPWGNPLPFSSQYLQALSAGRVELVDPVSVYSCNMEVPFVNDWPGDALQNDPNGFKPGKCRGITDLALIPTAAALSAELAKPHQGAAFAAVDGAFKIPTLRNVELTGPYMHNGGMKSLKEVVQFYNRGGNASNFGTFGQFVFKQGLTEQELDDLVAFLKSLTDKRLPWEKAPFDHPEIKLPNGYTTGTSEFGPGFAADLYETVPAVGRNGRSKAQGPLQSFEDGLTD